MAEGLEQPLIVLVSSAGVNWPCPMVPDEMIVSLAYMLSSKHLLNLLRKAPIALAPLPMLQVCPTSSQAHRFTQAGAWCCMPIEPAQASHLPTPHLCVHTGHPLVKVRRPCGRVQLAAHCASGARPPRHGGVASLQALRQGGRHRGGCGAGVLCDHATSPTTRRWTQGWVLRGVLAGVWKEWDWGVRA